MTGAHSSVGLEHLITDQGVGGSSPPGRAIIFYSSKKWVFLRDVVPSLAASQAGLQRSPNVLRTSFKKLLHFTHTKKRLVILLLHFYDYLIKGYPEKKVF